MAKVILVIEDDFEGNGVQVSHNLATFNGQTITTAMIVANLLTDMLGESFISACESEASALNKRFDREKGE